MELSQIPHPNRSLQESEGLFTQVRDLFWRQPQEDFVIKMSAFSMDGWALIPTANFDEMFTTRLRLINTPYGFAGFVHDDDGRYAFYYCDRNIFKVQYLDNLEICHFTARTFSEVSLKLVAEEYKLLKARILR